MRSFDQNRVQDISAVLFDMDGVLVDTFDAWLAVIEDCRKERGLPQLGVEAFRASWGQSIEADGKTLFPGEDPQRLAAEYDRAFVRHLPLIKAEEGAAETLQAIARAGMHRAVVTNSPVSLARKILEQVGLIGQFDCFAGGDEVRRGKPDPELILLALGRLGTKPRSAVFIGDTQMDLEAARASGVPMIGYRIGGGEARVERLADILPLIGLAGATGGC